MNLKPSTASQRHPASPIDEKRHDGAVRRALLNALWLLGGNGASGIFSLGYLAIAARTLGVHDFGIFATILTYGQGIENLCGFQSWQTIIRFGAAHLAQPGRMARVLGFATLLDLCAGAVGVLIAAVGAVFIGPLLGWSGPEQKLAAWFGLSLIVGQRDAPIGMLRLIDRFAIASAAEVSLPATRLLGACVAWAVGGGIGAFLLAWSAAQLAATIILWIAALREIRRHRLNGRLFALKGVRAENPGIIRFAITTNLSASLFLVWQQIPLLAVAWIAGPSGAGGYRIAAQLGNALSKPIGSFARSIYPEFARMAATGTIDAIKSSLQRVALLAVALGIAAVLLMAAAGRGILFVLGGQAYLFAYPVTLVLTIAAAVNLGGFGLEPALIAMGRPGSALGVRAASGALLIVLTVALLSRYGPIGAALAGVLANLTCVLLLHVTFRNAVIHRSVVATMPVRR